MAVTTKSCVPAVITAGDTVIISIGPDASYPNTGWTAQLVFSRDGKVLNAFTADSATDGTLGFVATISGTGATKLTPGRAMWAEVFTETATGQRETGRTGQLLIAPDPTKSLPDSEVAKALKACMAAINVIVSDPNATVNFNGQSFTSHNLSDLFKAHDRLQIKFDAELRSLGVSNRGGAKLILNRFR